MKKQWIFIAIFVLILVSFVYGLSPKLEPSLTQVEKTAILENLKYSDKISREVISQLEDKDKIRAIISLDDSNMYKLKKLEKIRPKIKENQQEVLKEVLGLKVIYQYNNINSMAVEIDAKYLAKLEASSFVKNIQEDKPMYLSLDESVPQINANDVWNLDADGGDCRTSGKPCLTGAGQTVCIVDTGVDYNHPAIGSSSCSIEPISHEDYSASWTWNTENYDLTITKSGYSQIAVHFSDIFIAGDWGNYEKIEIYNGSNILYQTLSSNMAIGENICETISDRWSVPVTGDTIKIHFVPYDSGSGPDDVCLNYGGGPSAHYLIDKFSNSPLWPNCGDFLGGFDFINNDVNPMDDNGHGTHVAGIITSDDATYKGVAPNAKIISAKVFPASGDGSVSVIARGIDYCIDMKNAYNVKIISLSLGDKQEHNSACDSGLADAEEVNVAFTNGIFVDAASGNEGFTNGVNSPACASGATSVGAVYDADVGSKSWSACTDSSTFLDKLVCFTNRKVGLLDLLAPGSVITSTNLTAFSLFTPKSGTSMAAPHVAGVAALMLEKNPSLTPTEIESIMKSSALVFVDGYPRIDALEAVNAVTAPAAISITSAGGLLFDGVPPGTSAQDTLDVTIVSNVAYKIESQAISTHFKKDGVEDATIPRENLEWWNSVTSQWIDYSATLTQIATGSSPGTTHNINHKLTVPSGALPANSPGYTLDVTVKVSQA